MIIKPKTRGFICTTTHPVGCEQNVANQIEYVKSQGKLTNAPKRVLVVGSSSGYGMPSRISAAFGGGANTIGVFFEKAPTERKTGSAGYSMRQHLIKQRMKLVYTQKALMAMLFLMKQKRKSLKQLKKI